jgi:hypothetical protein
VVNNETSVRDVPPSLMHKTHGVFQGVRGISYISAVVGWTGIGTKAWDDILDGAHAARIASVSDVHFKRGARINPDEIRFFAAFWGSIQTSNPSPLPLSATLTIFGGAVSSESCCDPQLCA